MRPRRVVVTGMGVFCALGKNCEQFRHALAAGQTAIGEFDGFPGLRFNRGARVPDYRPLDYFSERDLDLQDPFAQFARIAAREAVADSGIRFCDALRQATGVITGSCVGGKRTEDDQFRELYGANKSRVQPMTIPRTMANSGASLIGMEFGLTGPSFTLSTACSSSNHAIGHAFWMIRQGTIEAAITGGSEAPFTMGHLKAWEALRVVAPDTCRPFSKERKGLIVGEGAAMLVLEPLDRARARGAKIYAEIVGFGMNADAHHLTQPHVDGAARAMELALKDAELPPHAIGYINAHGTGTQANDVMETQAICRVFGAHAHQLAVSSTKSMHGHALGAAGAIEAVATVLALHHQFLPPTANYLSPDPDCALDVLPNAGRAAAVEFALSNSFAFGGLNAVLAFRRS